MCIGMDEPLLDDGLAVVCKGDEASEDRDIEKHILLENKQVHLEIGCEIGDGSCDCIAHWLVCAVSMDHACCQSITAT